MAMPEEAFIGAQVGGQDQDPSLTGPPYGNGRWVEGDTLFVSLVPRPEASTEGLLPTASAEGPDLHLVKDAAEQVDPSEADTIAFEAIHPFMPEDPIADAAIALKATRGLAAMRRRMSGDRRSEPYRRNKHQRENPVDAPLTTAPSEVVSTANLTPQQIAEAKAKLSWNSVRAKAVVAATWSPASAKHA